MSSTGNKIDVDYVLGKFEDVLDSEAPWAVKVRALELIGKYLNMFVEQKKVNIDVRQLVAGASLDELRKLAGGENESVVIDVDAVGVCDRGGRRANRRRLQPAKAKRTRRASAAANKQAGDGGGKSGGHPVDQGCAEKDRGAAGCGG